MKKEDVLDAVRDYLDSEGFHYEYNAEREYLNLNFNLKSKLKEAHLVIDFKNHGFLVLAIAPLNGDKNNLGELLKYTTMANFGLINGNFEVDVEDGEIRYKTWTGTEGLTALSREVIEDAVNIPLAMTDRYGDGLAALTLGFSTAEDEIKKVEEKMAARSAK